MAYPFFSLAKSKRTVPIDFRAARSPYASNVPEHGMATIWDADVLIWLAADR
jgi:plasmid replication initiation protein